VQTAGARDGVVRRHHRREAPDDDPYSPKEVGYFIPAITEATDSIRVEGRQRCKVAIQSNNIETDDRGYIYVVERANTGLHILELTGEARQAAGLQ
jgi:hypothetical protein